MDDVFVVVGDDFAEMGLVENLGFAGQIFVYFIRIITLMVLHTIDLRP